VLENLILNVFLKLLRKKTLKMAIFGLLWAPGGQKIVVT
jgi:hypothetical protein